jgi:hypothetical protein
MKGFSLALSADLQATRSIARSVRCRRQLHHGRSVVAFLRPGASRKASANLARAGRVDYLLGESMGVLERLPGAEPRLGRRTALTFPLLPPPQKN